MALFLLFRGEDLVPEALDPVSDSPSMFSNSLDMFTVRCEELLWETTPLLAFAGLLDEMTSEEDFLDDREEFLEDYNKKND